MAHFMMHSALTIMGVNPAGLLDASGKPAPRDKEICQFAAEFKRSPVPIHYFERAFDEMKAACLAKAREAGLVTEDRHTKIT